jgi:uracil-DNA glycosylase
MACNCDKTDEVLWASEAAPVGDARVLAVDRSEMAAVRPDVVVCLGATATQAMLGPKAMLKALRGQIVEVHSTCVTSRSTPPLFCEHPMPTRVRTPTGS